MGLRFWERGILMLVLWGRLTCAVVTVRFPLCPTESITDSIFRFQDSFCPISSNDFRDIVGVIEWISWKPLDWPWCSLNADGAHNREGISTAGGLICDHMGRWLSGFGMIIGSCFVTIAELWGLYQGLQLAWNSGIRKLKVEIDSRCVLQLVTKPTLEINHYAPLIRAIKDYLKMDWQVSISHIYR